MVKYFIQSVSLLVPRLVKADDCNVLFACLPETKNNKLFGFICVTFSKSLLNVVSRILVLNILFD